MRAIDQYTPNELDTLRLKGMIAERPAWPTPAEQADFWKRKEDQFQDFLNKLRKEQHAVKR